MGYNQIFIELTLFDNQFKKLNYDNSPQEINKSKNIYNL